MNLDKTQKEAPALRRRRRPGWQLMIAAGLLLALVGSFFVGRRVYYRMIQPTPLWTVPTPKTETVVCDDGFEISLWADESLVSNPSSLCVDTRGRVWVSEAVHYRDQENVDSGNSQSSETVKSDGQTRKSHREDLGDRIVILSDTDNNGIADSRVIFVQDPDLIAPLGVCVLGNQAFVSCSPGIYVFTDDDGDDRADRKDVLLTGFGGRDHDHGVHSVVPGPDGRLYFAVGNAGPHLVTDRTGWTLRAGSYYQSSPQTPGTESSGKIQTTTTLNTGGLISDDKRIYVGGLVLSVQPDGSDLRVHSHNARNPYEVGIDSFGDVWQSDNDDTASCRITWLMNGANTGFASADGSRSWQADQRPGQLIPEAHWHQGDPGVVPAGLIYGTGAPTGLTRCESAIGGLSQGSLLACDAGLGCVNVFQPIAEGAGFRFDRSRLVWSEQNSSTTSERPDGLALTWFRPTDIAASPLGELFVADWYDSYVGGHRVNDKAAAGRIYVLRPREDSQKMAAVKAGSSSLDEISSETALLRNESATVRWEARKALLKRGATAIPALKNLQKDDDLFVHARTLWILAEMGDVGRRSVEADLNHPESQIRITALRSLVAAGVSPVDLVTIMINDRSSAVQREVAVLLRGKPLEQTRALLIQLATQLDGRDRTAIEAFGLACEGYEELLYPELRLRLGNSIENWSEQFSSIVWRLHPSAVLPDLNQRLALTTLTSAEQMRTLDTIAFIGTKEATEILNAFAAKQMTLKGAENAAASRSFEFAAWWAMRLKEIDGKTRSVASIPSSTFDIQFQPGVLASVDSELVSRIAGLPGDPVIGGDLFFGTKGTCSTCHRVANRGGEVGPNLAAAGLRFNRRQLVESILYPSNAILTGYESWAATDIHGRVFAGLLISVGNDVVLKSADGKNQSVPAAEIEHLSRQGISLMPESLGRLLTEQEIANIVAFLLQRPLLP